MLGNKPTVRALFHRAGAVLAVSVLVLLSSMLAAGAQTSVRAWGGLEFGQLGDGTDARRTTPVQASGLTGVIATASGTSHSLALKSDGTVWAWGDNQYGQLGNGTGGIGITSNVPVQVSGLTGVIAVAGGGYHSLAVKSDGTVWAWGLNTYGQLGNGTTTTTYPYGSTVPVQTIGLTGIVAIAGGGYHSLAVKSDGTVWAWGRNDSGQLGNGTTTSNVPVQVSGLAGIVAVAGGGSHSLAVKLDGTVWAWGDNQYGQLGNGTSGGISSVPVQVSGLTGVIAVAGGLDHSLALKSDGTVWAWGRNDLGQLGNGTFTTTPPYGSNVPVQVLGPSGVGNLTGVVAIAGGYNHSLAVKSDGTIWAWGYNAFGELGNGTNTDSNTPVQTRGLTGVIAIAGGYFHSLAVKSDGTVWAWGANTYGQLGNGTNTNSNVPVQVLGLTGVIAVASRYNHSLAVKSDGTVWAWGYNQYGQLGNGTGGIGITSNVPVQVSGLTGVIAVASGYNHSLAVKSDGTVWAWGYNNYGQLGASTASSNVPVQTRGLTGVIAIAGGTSHSLAVKSDGTVWAWGRNFSGELGNGTNTDSNTPIQTRGLTGVIAIAGGSSTNTGTHSLALKSDGTVWAWGRNTYGQLGDGTSGNIRTVPVQVSGLTGVIAIAGGDSYSLAVKSDGTVWAWGLNTYGQLGNGTTTNSNTPVQTSGLTGGVAIAGGGSHSLAVVASNANATVSGTLTLQSCVNSVQPMTFVFRPTDGSAPLTRTATLDATGAFRLPDIPRNSYHVWIKGAKWLAKVVPVDTSMGDVSGVTATLLAGDANNDNHITTADYLLLKVSFGATASDPNWNNGAADFNCDGVVSTADYLLLKQNFGQVGDP